MALCRVTSSPATAAKKTTKLGYSALEAGSASLPVTVMMLFFAAKSGELAQRIGPRLQMTVGPLVVGVSFLLMARIEPDSGYLVSVPPAVVIFGVGLVITVAPLTATVLAAVEPWAGPIDGTRRSASRHPYRAAGQRCTLPDMCAVLHDQVHSQRASCVARQPAPRCRSGTLMGLRAE